MRSLSSEEDDENTEFNEGRALRLSILIYGSALVGIILCFSWLRRRFPKIYNVRGWADDLKTYLAEDQYKFFSWMWRVYMITDDEIMQECGLDAACFVRLIQMGFRLSLVALGNMIWLLPVYYTAEESDETADITDRVVKTTVANVPSGSPRLFATVFAAYIMFGYTMYMILREFEWYIETRHKFLRKPLARNFSVFVRNIPHEYTDNQRLATFFRQCFSDEAVLEARLPMHIPNLTKAVAQRDGTLANLEHSLALYQRNGVRPRHKDLLTMLGNDVDSIEYFTAHLEEQNQDVAERITALEAIVNGTAPQREIDASTSVDTEFYDSKERELRLELPPALSPNTPGEEVSPEIDQNISGLTTHASTDHESSIVGRRLKSSAKTLKKSVGNSVGLAASAAGKATTAASGLAKSAVSMVMGGEDGEIHAAGFVVFNKLSTSNAALQMVQSATPFAMEIVEAPDPKDVYWGNIGRTHKDLQVGKLASFGMTAALCLLWTIPMSFFASLANASAVREDVGWLDNLFNRYPGLVELTEQAAPFLVVLFNAILPIVLETISKLEGPISSGMVEASKFTKLAIFMIVQTFFVSAVSGSVIQAISDIMDDLTEIIDLLANSLPAQGTYFMQILIVSTAVSAGMELLRVVPLGMAAVRKRVGPQLTKKERHKVFMGLRPLNVPPDFEHADFTSQLVLYFMVLFVYATISPMTPCITSVCFLFMGSMFRNQFIYIYDKHPDSGGKLWAQFIQVLLSCMLIAEITIFGLLGLKKAVKQLPVYIPLLVITFLFNLYIRQVHFRVASYLPTRECLKEDLQRSQDFDFSFVQGAYVQPPLAAPKTALPDPELEHPSNSLENPQDEEDIVVNDI